VGFFFCVFFFFFFFCCFFFFGFFFSPEDFRPLGPQPSLPLSAHIPTLAFVGPPFFCPLPSASLLLENQPKDLQVSPHRSANFFNFSANTRRCLSSPCLTWMQVQGFEPAASPERGGVPPRNNRLHLCQHGGCPFLLSLSVFESLVFCFPPLSPYFCYAFSSLLAP